MSETPGSPRTSPEQRKERLQRIDGGVLVGLVIVGFFLVMLLLLPEARPLFVLLLGVGAGIAFWMEARVKIPRQFQDAGLKPGATV